MDRFHRHGDLNGAEKVDRHVRSAVDRSRRMERPNTFESVRQEIRSAPVAAAYITTNRSERQARREEHELRRRDRVVGHTMLGAAAFVVFVAMLPILGSLVTFAVAVVALFVGLRSLTFAVSIRLDDAWGWTRDGGMSAALGWSDHVVLAGMAWLRRRSEATIDSPPGGAIQVLPPEPPR